MKFNKLIENILAESDKDLYTEGMKYRVSGEGIYRFGYLDRKQPYQNTYKEALEYRDYLAKKYEQSFLLFNIQKEQDDGTWN